MLIFPSASHCGYRNCDRMQVTYVLSRYWSFPAILLLIIPFEQNKLSDRVFMHMFRTTSLAVAWKLSITDYTKRLMRLMPSSLSHAAVPDATTESIVHRPPDHRLPASPRGSQAWTGQAVLGWSHCWSLPTRIFATESSCQEASERWSGALVWTTRKATTENWSL